MSVDVVPYPTAHLAWLGPAKAATREKVLSSGTARALLARPVIVEEKPDGALIGIGFPDGISPRVQFRSGWLGPGAHAQFQPLWGWLAMFQDALADKLGKSHVLFGEWCYATHAVRHDALPDWFLACDVVEPATGRCWTAARRNALARSVGLAVVPEVLRNKVDLPTLTERLGGSSLLGSGAVAGLIVRLEAGDHLVERALLIGAAAAAGGEPSTQKTLARNARVVGASSEV